MFRRIFLNVEDTNPLGKSLQCTATIVSDNDRPKCRVLLQQVNTHRRPIGSSINGRLGTHAAIVWPRGIGQVPR